MRFAVTITGLTLLALSASAPLSAFALGFNSLEWEIGGLKNEVQNLNSTLQRQQSLDTFRSLSNSRSAILQKLQGMGFQAFYATNEGSIRAGTSTTAQCPVNASALLDYCVCDQGYAYTGIVNKCQKGTVPSLDEIRKQCPNFPVPDEYPYLQKVCKGISPDAEMQYKSCPANSYVDPTDNAYCLCNGDFQWNSSKTQCLRKVKPAVTPAVSGRQVIRACKRDKDGVCQCPTGLKLTSQRGRQMCSK